MAYEIPGFSFTLPAAADFSTVQFRAVNVDAAGKAALAGAAGRVLGVMQNKPKTNEGTTIVCNGVSKFETGAAVAAGATVEVDASGRAITRAAGIPVGIALEASSGAGIVIAVFLRPANL